MINVQYEISCNNLYYKFTTIVQYYNNSVNLYYCVQNDNIILNQ